MEEYAYKSSQEKPRNPAQPAALGRMNEKVTARRFWVSLAFFALVEMLVVWRVLTREFTITEAVAIVLPGACFLFWLLLPRLANSLLVLLKPLPPGVQAVIYGAVGGVTIGCLMYLPIHYLFKLF